MTTFRLKYVKAYEDRHGKRRHYYRRPGSVQVALPGEPGSADFMEAYRAAQEGAPKRMIGEKRTKPGSFSALIGLYYTSTSYQTLAPITKATYRNVLEHFRNDRGDLPVRGIKYKHVAAMLDALAEKPGAQKSLRRMLSILLTFAKERGWREDNPMVGIRRPRRASEGFRPWDEADIALYLKHWPTGSRERLALALLLYTAQRRKDVVSMGRQHVREGKIRVVQSKTGTALWIPVHAKLRAELDAAPKDQLTFLQTQYGQPFTSAGFGNWFSESAKAAGLPAKSSPHGLRKASARRLAEAGCSANEIMAITGHKNLSEVATYTASADQERLADGAMAKAEKRTKLSNPRSPVRQNG